MSPSIANWPQATTSPSTPHHAAVERHGRLDQALRVRLPLRQRRAAQLADDVARRFRARRVRILHACGSGSRLERRQVGSTMTRVSSKRCSPARARRVEFRRLRERRDANDQGQAVLRRTAAGTRPALSHRQAPGGDRIDAAGALGLARREAHQPAVDPALLRRCAGVQAGVLDAGQQVGVDRSVRSSAVSASVATRLRPFRWANSTKACAPLEAGSKTTPGRP